MCRRKLLCAPRAPEVAPACGHHGVHILLVILETRRVAEALPADAASVWLLPGVRPLMLS